MKIRFSLLTTGAQSREAYKITAAFKDEPYPGDAKILYDNTGFHLECIEVRDTFIGHTWQQVPNDALSTERTGLSFMSEEGFKYYLPAFMCSLLRDRSIVDDGISMVVQLLKLPAEIDIVLVAEQVQRYDVASQLPDVDLNEVLQNQLSQTNNSINAFVSRASKFTRVQARAIYYFLLYTRAESGDDFLSNEANLAMQRYWFQFA